MKKIIIVLAGTAVSTASALLARIDPNPAIQREFSQSVCEEMAHQQGARDMGICIKDLRDAPNELGD